MIESKITWHKPSEQLPKLLKRVLVIVQIPDSKKMRIAIAEHVRPLTILADDYLCDDAMYYMDDMCDIVDDVWYVKEGWFESNLGDEINYQLNGNILYWSDVEKPDAYIL